MEYNKYSVFIINRRQYFDNNTYMEDIMEWLETFNTLQEARDYQQAYDKEYALKTIIIATY